MSCFHSVLKRRMNNHYIIEVIKNKYLFGLILKHIKLLRDRVDWTRIVFCQDNSNGGEILQDIGYTNYFVEPTFTVHPRIQKYSRINSVEWMARNGYFGLLDDKLKRQPHRLLFNVQAFKLIASRGGRSTTPDALDLFQRSVALNNKDLLECNIGCCICKCRQWLYWRIEKITILESHLTDDPRVIANMSVEALVWVLDHMHTNQIGVSFISSVVTTHRRDLYGVLLDDRRITIPLVPRITKLLALNGWGREFQLLTTNVESYHSSQELLTLAFKSNDVVFSQYMFSRLPPFHRFEKYNFYDLFYMSSGTDAKTMYGLFQNHFLNINIYIAPTGFIAWLCEVYNANLFNNHLFNQKTPTIFNVINSILSFIGFYYKDNQPERHDQVISRFNEILELNLNYLKLSSSSSSSCKDSMELYLNRILLYESARLMDVDVQIITDNSLYFLDRPMLYDSINQHKGGFQRFNDETNALLQVEYSIIINDSERFINNLSLIPFSSRLISSLVVFAIGHNRLELVKILCNYQIPEVLSNHKESVDVGSLSMLQLLYHSAFRCLIDFDCIFRKCTIDLFTFLLDIGHQEMDRAVAYALKDTESPDRTDIVHYYIANAKKPDNSGQRLFSSISTTTKLQDHQLPLYYMQNGRIDYFNEITDRNTPLSNEIYFMIGYRGDIALFDYILKSRKDYFNMHNHKVYFINSVVKACYIYGQRMLLAHIESSSVGAGHFYPLLWITNNQMDFFEHYFNRSRITMIEKKEILEYAIQHNKVHLADSIWKKGLSSVGATTISKESVIVAINRGHTQILEFLYSIRQMVEIRYLWNMKTVKSSPRMKSFLTYIKEKELNKINK
ncbi:hypothetical protein DFA_11689 [Cavenderia fasciculata]|uniref:Uncharacterized protein n=1 Tax=Cavenderia fasciculata TaxID=261658 RepID=F4QDY1_CACFS|nr:uncharacterized protein DFA_11689 [Cavenderia fasciculata]EGG13928.1 hypothetical protein DFA_11689 [Cavenderia fasciculata]|eukprot:XP_004350636.1 hypothetical protein DFA_11689 [Cavenderia fasciculata]